MVEKQVTILISEGLHMRPAGVLASALSKFSSDIFLLRGKDQINAKSVISLMQAALACGDTVTVRCNGHDEQEALECAVKILQTNNTPMEQMNN